MLSCDAPIAQLAEAADLKSAKCRFESDWGHREMHPVTALPRHNRWAVMRLTK